MTLPRWTMAYNLTGSETLPDSAKPAHAVFIDAQKDDLVIVLDAAVAKATEIRANEQLSNKGITSQLAAGTDDARRKVQALHDNRVGYFSRAEVNIAKGGASKALPNSLVGYAESRGLTVDCVDAQLRECRTMFAGADRLLVFDKVLAACEQAQPDLLLSVLLAPPPIRDAMLSDEQQEQARRVLADAVDPATVAARADLEACRQLFIANTTNALRVVADTFATPTPRPPAGLKMAS